VAKSSEQSWWQRTKLLAIASLAGGGTVSLLFMLLAPALDRNNLAGIPFGLLAAILIAPAFVLFLIFRSAARQHQIDRAQGHFED